MKASCTLAASILAASAAAALTSSTSYASQDHSVASYHPPTSPEVCSSRPKVKSNASKSVEKEKFSARFDGLKFIETLVTAHR